jgi:glycine dehydrogenase subunit 1
MDAANSSLYDGASSLAEAALMAARVTQRARFIVCGSVSPFHKKVLKTYIYNHDIELIELTPGRAGPDFQKIKEKLDESIAGLIVQNPSFTGSVSDYTEISEAVHKAGALVIMSVYPVSLGMLKKPSEMGADIAVGEGQSLGMPLSFGGPYLGFIACKMELIRNLPGRIAGETVDRNGKRCYVLTLQAREQHIRRQKATSNICSNQSLCALRAVIFLSLLGENGFRELAKLNYNKSEYLKGLIGSVKNASVWNGSPTFNEFVIELSFNASDAVRALLEKGLSPGLPLGMLYPGMDNMLLVAVTEKRTREEIEYYASALEAIL